MAIVFPCECGQELQAKDEHAGRRTRCPQCGREVPIPGIQAAPAAEPPLRPDAVTARDRPDVSHLQQDDEWEERGRRRRAPSSGMGGPWIAVVVLGVLGGMCLLCAVPIGLLLPAVQKVREAATRIQSANNLKQISLGMINYADAHNGQLPPAVVYDKDGKPLYSWRVVLLPYIEQDALFSQFHLDEPWDSPNNRALLSRMPKTYARPGAPPGETTTFYQVFDGPSAAFDSNPRNGLKPFDPFDGGAPGLGAPAPRAKGGLQRSAASRRYPADFADGTSNTILVIEAGDAVPWTQPVDLPFDPKGPLPKLGSLFNGGFNVGLADGSVRFIQKGVSQETVRAAITINGGEALGPDW